MRMFIDTSAFYALLDRDDENYSKGKKAWTEILEAGHTLVTSNYVLVETFALLQSRLGLDAVRGFQEDLVPILHVEFVTSDPHRLGVAALLSASRRGLSLVDCVSFEVMRNSGIKTAFTFDSHFKEQGFSVVP
jgi:predicted nucleic acid-binding protein